MTLSADEPQAAVDPEVPATGDEYEEWDDTPTALFLRALFTLIAGGYLSWAQWHAAIPDAGAEWGRWVEISVIANLVLPLGIVWFFFAQSVRHVPYLKNQALNAWNYGFNFSEFKTHIKWAGAMTAIMLPFVFVASRDPKAHQYYASHLCFRAAVCGQKPRARPGFRQRRCTWYRP